VREQVAMGKPSGHPHIVTIFQVGTTTTKEAGAHVGSTGPHVGSNTKNPIV
jgi:hypothetical protein